jgi:hypothetical protein
MQPDREVSDVNHEDLHAGSVGFDLRARRLGDERRCAARQIPVVVGEVMERRLGDRPTHRPAVGSPLTVDDDGKIEATTGRRASAVREHSGFGHRRGQDEEDAGADRRADTEQCQLKGADTSLQMVGGAVCDRSTGNGPSTE